MSEKRIRNWHKFFHVFLGFNFFAEPDLSVLANQVKEVLNGTVLIVLVGLGVGIFLVLAILKIIFKIE